MDEHPVVDMNMQQGQPIEENPLAESPLIEETSTEYLGRWNRLISTTNWEKGRIICEWRSALVAAEAPPTSYTDEAWSRWAGNVSPQHVGRLRRVHDRFGQDYQRYSGLYWSHFQAALDWADAEMWLQGASDSGWSISQMRYQRWEAIGAPEDKRPRAEDIVQAELDEDVREDYDGDPPEFVSGSIGEVQPDDRSPDDRSHDDGPHADSNATADDDPSEAFGEGPVYDEEGPLAVEPLRPFEDLPTLPPDLNEAFEGFKLAILHHKVSGWREISCDDVLSTLNALKQLALAPADVQD